MESKDIQQHFRALKTHVTAQIEQSKNLTAQSSVVEVDSIKSLISHHAALESTLEKLNALVEETKEGIKTIQKITNEKIEKINATINELRNIHPNVTTKLEPVPAINLTPQEASTSKKTKKANTTPVATPVATPYLDIATVKSVSKPELPFITDYKKKPVAVSTTVAVQLPTKSINITNRYSLDAVVLANYKPESFNDLRPGVLYYIESMNHFAIKINNQMFNGNIGVVYDYEDTPVQTIECYKGPTCAIENCRFYHEPMRCKGKKDIRNYFTNSWTYYGPDVQAKTDTSKCRKLSSVVNIATDIHNVDAPYIERVKSQIMHDLLCIMLAIKYVGKN
jgi:hypothetical protein